MLFQIFALFVGNMSRAGRGKGRGRGNFSINIETIGFGRGDQLPAPTLQPPPKYPVSMYILDLKQSLLKCIMTTDATMF